MLINDVITFTELYRSGLLIKHLSSIDLPCVAWVTILVRPKSISNFEQSNLLKSPARIITERESLADHDDIFIGGTHIALA